MRFALLVAATMAMYPVPGVAAILDSSPSTQQPPQQLSTRSRLSKLEQTTFGSTRNDQSVIARLGALELEILGAKHPNDDLMERLVRLEAAYGGTKKKELPAPAQPNPATQDQSPIKGLTTGAGKADVSGILADAVTAYDKKQIAKAKDLFEKVLEVEPANPDANFSLGCIAEDRGDLVRALKYYQRAHDANSSDDEVAQAIKGIKQKMDEQSQPKQAVADDVAKATAEYRAGNYGAAKKALEHILTINPKSDRAHFALGECMRHLGDRRGAVAHVREAVRLKPENAIYKEGLSRLTSGREDDFVVRDPSRRLGEIIPIDLPGGVVPRRVDSVSWQARNLIAQARIIIDGFLSAQQAGDSNSVEQFRARLNDLHRSSADPTAESLDEGSTYHSRGSREAKQGLLGDALADYRKAFSLNPWDASETLDLVSLEMNNHEWTMAEQHCMAAVGCKPSLVEGWFDLGLILTQKREYQKAATCFAIADMQSGDTGASTKLLEMVVTKADDSTVKGVLQKALQQSQTYRRLYSIGVKFVPGPDIPDPALTAYRLNLLVQLADQWQPQSQHSDAILVATINKDGKLVNNELVKSSGDKSCDERAIQAIKAISIQPLPNWYMAQERQFIINFEKVNRVAQSAAAR